MPLQNIRVAFDTTIWISFSIGKRMENLKDIFINKAIQIIICQEIINEYVRIANSKKLSKYLTKQRISNTLELIETFAENKNVSTKVKLSRDPDDDYLLAFSKENKLDYLITGDKDLLVIKKHFNTHIVTFSYFLETIKQLKK
jgi:hypothetical protein